MGKLTRAQRGGSVASLSSSSFPRLLLNSRPEALIQKDKKSVAAKDQEEGADDDNEPVRIWMPDSARSVRSLPVSTLFASASQAALSSASHPLSSSPLSVDSQVPVRAIPHVPRKSELSDIDQEKIIYTAKSKT